MTERGIQYEPDGPIRGEDSMGEAAMSSHIWSGDKWTHERHNRWSPWKRLDTEPGARNVPNGDREFE